jgi:hypothetical protein
MKTITFVLLITLFAAVNTRAQVVADSGKDSSVKGYQHSEAPKIQESYVNYTQAGIGVRLGKPVLSISSVNGYQFSRRIALGGGVGYSRTYIPLWSAREADVSGGILSFKNIKSSTVVNLDELDLFAELKLFFSRKGSAFLLFDIGYSFLLSPKNHLLTLNEKTEWIQQSPNSYMDTLVKTTYSDRFYIAPGIGGRYTLTRNQCLNIAVQLYISGYKTKHTYDPGSAGMYINYQTYQKISLYPVITVGIGFRSE